jgi:hypothetical protein
MNVTQVMVSRVTRSFINSLGCIMIAVPTRTTL